MHRRAFFQFLGAAALLSCSRKYIPYDRPVQDDVFILLPGISGSELYVDGNPVWSLKLGSIWDTLKSFGGNLNRLTLHSDPKDIYDLGDGVSVGTLIPDTHLIPGFWKIDGYTQIRDKLIKAFELKPGENYFDFAYDWRRDNRISATQLKRFSSTALDTWRKTSGKKEAKLILVCHSMGGLIARYFLEVLEGWRDTRAFITLGTPFRGSVKALDYLVNGYLPHLESVTDTLRSFTSAYQLLPIFKCCYGNSGNVKRALLDFPAIHNLDIKRVQEAIIFHQEIRDHAEQNSKNADYKFKRYKTCHIVGVGQPTPLTTRVSANMLAVTTDDAAGDGTVPREAAEPPKSEPLSSAYYVHEFHASI